MSAGNGITGVPESVHPLSCSHYMSETCAAVHGWQLCMPTRKDVLQRLYAHRKMSRKLILCQYWSLALGCSLVHAQLPFLLEYACTVRRILLASDALELSPAIWLTALQDATLPMVAGLAQAVGTRGRSHGGADRSLRMAVVLLSKVILQYLRLLAPLPEFPGLWLNVLQVNIILLMSTYHNRGSNISVHASALTSQVLWDSCQSHEDSLQPLHVNEMFRHMLYRQERTSWR